MKDQSIVCLAKDWNKGPTARDAQVESLIRWLGWKRPEGVPSCVSAPDLACSSSHMEGALNAALEAFLCGKRIVSRAVGRVPKVANSSTGIAAAPHNARRLRRPLQAATA